MTSCSSMVMCSSMNTINERNSSTECSLGVVGVRQNARQGKARRDEGNARQGARCKGQGKRNKDKGKGKGKGKGKDNELGQGKRTRTRARTRTRRP
jgi:hypothetical protein